MFGIPLSHYLIFAALLFSIGLYGVITRRNVIGILLSIELMINAGNINLIAFSRYLAPDPITGPVFSLFVILLAACAAAIGLAIVLSYYRNQKTVLTEDMNLIKW